VQTNTVVEAEDVIGNVTSRLCVIGVVALPNALHLQVQKEPLHQCVVPTIPFAAHAAANAMLGEQSLIFGAGILAKGNLPSDFFNEIDPYA
jgi:hypothetical protein